MRAYALESEKKRDEGGLYENRRINARREKGDEIIVKVS